jgi:hypothetical protein
MRMEHTAIFEQEELMLTTTFHCANPRAAKRAQARRRHAAPQRRMEQLDGADRLARRDATYALDRVLDLGKLWHRSLFSG